MFTLLLQNPSLLVLAGLTGSGKTQLLKAVDSFWPTINLERAAQHCGSVFGHIPYKNDSEKAAVSQSRFESHIFSELNESIHSKQPILVEDEGRRIGRNHLPASLYQIMRDSPRIWIQLPLTSRIQNIVDEYFSDADTNQTESLMMTALERLHKFINKEARENLKQSLIQKDYESFVHYLLTTHYDARYRSHPPHIIHTIKANDLEHAKTLLTQWLKELPLPFSYKTP